MTKLDRAIAALAKTAGTAHLATAIGGTTDELRVVVQSLQEAISDVETLLDDDATPETYVGWCAGATFDIPDSIPTEWTT